VVPSSDAIEALPLIRETNIKPSELFTVTYRVKNRSAREIATRIVHRVEPKELKQHLDIVECALLLPVKMLPRQESEFSTTYMVRGDLPESAKNLNITYEFQVAH
jgi:cytochrome c oxidase assembly protein Cox11